MCKNINKLNIRNSQLINDSINADKIRNKSIIYFYNPFSENMTYDFFKKISLNKNLKQLIIIYVNPQYTKVLNQYKWNIVYEKKVSTQNINIWIKMTNNLNILKTKDSELWNKLFERVQVSQYIFIMTLSPPQIVIINIILYTKIKNYWLDLLGIQIQKIHVLLRTV